MEHLEVLRSLANGVDPVTGEVLQPDHLCQQPQVIRALFHAVAAISTPASTSRSTPMDSVALSAEEQIKYNALRQWRQKAATAYGIAPFMIAHNRQLVEMIRLPVRQPADFLKIKGFGKSRADTYGAAILDVLGEGQTPGDSNVIRLAERTGSPSLGSLPASPPSTPSTS